jgi:deoxyribose-phosphate aldolase
MTLPLNKYIDHVILGADATRAQIEAATVIVRKYDFAAISVNTCWTKLVGDLLAGSSVKIGVTVGFPLGATTTLVKMFEADQAIEAGAQEIDMVMNVGALKSGLYDFVKADIAGVVSSCHKSKRKRALLKVIIETGLLTDAEKMLACEIVKAAGAEFVKTCSGFNGGGATVEDVKLMRAAVGPEMGVKAAGGIRSYKAARAMIDAGATRIGTSAGPAIMDGRPAGDGY